MHRIRSSATAVPQTPEPTGIRAQAMFPWNGQEQGYPSPAHKIIFSIRLYSSELVLAIMVTKLVSPAISELKSRNKSL